LTPEQVKGAFENAIRLYCGEQQGRVYQTDGKPVTVLAVDELIGSLGLGQGRPMPLLYANGMRDKWRPWAIKRLQHMVHRPEECLVDLNVQWPQPGGRHPYEVLLTVESECIADHAECLPRGPIRDDLENDLLWDFYKLLVLPSPRRLMVTRSAREHHENVWRCFGELLERYRDQVIDPGGQVQLWSIQLPTAAPSDGADGRAHLGEWRVERGNVTSVVHDRAWRLF
jgi:hypothetical protein